MSYQSNRLYKVEIDCKTASRSFSEIFQWLLERYDRDSYGWEPTRDNLGNTISSIDFLFSDENAAVLFKLTFGGQQ